jgi:hypothetical protein
MKSAETRLNERIENLERRIDELEESLFTAIKERLKLSRILAEALDTISTTLGGEQFTMPDVPKSGLPAGQTTLNGGGQTTLDG